MRAGNVGARKIVLVDVRRFPLSMPLAPVLLDIHVNGEASKAVALTSKQGFVYVFNRVTGEHDGQDCPGVAPSARLGFCHGLFFCSLLAKNNLQKLGIVSIKATRLHACNTYLHKIYKLK